MKWILMVMMMAAVMAAGCGSVQQKQTQMVTVGVEEFAKITTQADVRLVDVRTPKEYDEGHLSGAENIDVKDSLFGDRIKGIEGTVAVYCRGGRRSLQAAELLAANGCTVYNLDGGILAWQKAGKPTTTDETDVSSTPAQ